ncbi:MAG TPA: hypothetical protein VMW27_22915, partial [Thermoanaerobaculia bacterium]|nr:hypothetical protein [Thermoanaerobaculia bacterium]
EGQSLVSLLAPGETDPTSVERFRYSFSEAGQRQEYFQSVQDASWKLVYDLRHRNDPRKPGGFELYHLAKDPLETRNLATAHTGELRRLRRELLGWQKDTNVEGDQGDDAETEKALKALGYLN